MTTHYIDLSLAPDPEVSLPQLLGALYDRLHLALVHHRTESVGVSFPRYSLDPRSLGPLLRLHGQPLVLEKLMSGDWLKGTRDYVRVSDVAPAPADALHRTVQRRQFKTSAERLRRRRMRRKGESPEQAAKAIPISVERRPDLPYVWLRSRSTGQPYCLFIALGPLRPDPVPGAFNSYGLSSSSTIPWF